MTARKNNNADAGTKRKKAGIVKRVLRFLFVGIWESAYRRKKQRALFHYDAFDSQPSKSRQTYYSRYHWIRGKKADDGKETADDG